MDLTLFGQHLLTLTSPLQAWVLLAACGSTAAGAWWTRQRLLLGVDDHGLRVGGRVGNVLGLLGAVAAGAGLRVVQTTFGPGAVGVDLLLGYATAASVVTAVGAGTSAVFSAVVGHGLSNTPALLGRGQPLPALEAALAHLDDLAATVRALEGSHKTARALVGASTDAELKEDHRETQEGVEQSLRFARDLHATAAVAILKAHCAGVLSGVLQHRPDHTLSGWRQDKAPEASARAVDAALAATNSFLEQAGAAKHVLENESSAAPGSAAARMGVLHPDVVVPYRQSLDELTTAYARIRERLATLQLRLAAQQSGQAALASARGVAHAASGSTGDDVEALLGALLAADHSASTMLQQGSPDVGALSRAVGQTRAALSSGAEPELGQLLSTMRKLSAPDSKDG
jgi:hypothetical protein